MVEAYLNLGNIFYRRRGFREKATEMYKQVLMIDPNHKMAHNNLGVLFMQQGLLNQARNELSTALNQDPDYVDALYNMACLAAREKRPAQALGYLTRAADIQPQAIHWAAEDQDLQSLKRLTEFRKLMAASQSPSTTRTVTHEE